MQTQAVQEVFHALADPTRRQLLQRLAEGGPATITQLSGGLPISRQAVTKHLETLTVAKLVSSEALGRERRYVLAPSPLHAAMEWMAVLGARWDKRLAALKDLVEEE